LINWELIVSLGEVTEISNNISLYKSEINQGSGLETHGTSFYSYPNPVGMSSTCSIVMLNTAWPATEYFLGHGSGADEIMQGHE
jgi:hypothetical protein